MALDWSPDTLKREIIDELLSEPFNLQADERRPRQKVSGLKYRDRRSRSGSQSSSSQGLSCRQHTRRLAKYGSQYLGEIQKSIPTVTSDWDIYCLQSTGIYYNNYYHASSTEILDIIYNKTGVFGLFNAEQTEKVKLLQDSISFDCSVSELLEFDDMYAGQHKIIQGMVNDIVNLRNKKQNPYDTVVEIFIQSCRRMVNLQCQHLTCGYPRKAPVPKTVFVDMFKIFVQMVGLIPSPGKVWKSTMPIGKDMVTGETDVVIIPGDDDDIKIERPVSIASIIEVKSFYKTERHVVEKNSKSIRSSNSADSIDSHDSEPNTPEEPAIYKNIPLSTLAQHGAELLLHHGYYGKRLSEGRKIKYLPGMIILGTEVIFTLLVVSTNHILELEQTEDLYPTKKSYIYYSEPKDILKKEDRDLLIESFARLKNIS